MQIKDIVKEMEDILGKDKFLQFAFYLSPAEYTGLKNPWVKVETELAPNKYRAWQSRTEDTLEKNMLNCLDMMRKDIAEES